jgi:hypothetical protein
VPLSELEKLLVVTACRGNTGWHHLLYRAKLYAPHLSNYSGAAGGCTFPSAAGFHTSNTFFTDDEGVYLRDNRDAPACADPAPSGACGDVAGTLLRRRDRIAPCSRHSGRPRRKPSCSRARPRDCRCPAHRTWWQVWRAFRMRHPLQERT